MKKFLALFMVLCMCFAVCGCSDSSYEDNYSKSSYDEDVDNNDYDYEYNNDDDYEDDNDYSYFSNKYGTRTTKCAQSGCSNYIASSGDTAYCVTHSNKCLECYCYIDNDAMYCLDCLADAADDIYDNNDDGYDYDDDYDYDDYNDYSHECYICGDSAYSKYGSYYYCSSCLELVKAFS